MVFWSELIENKIESGFKITGLDNETHFKCILNATDRFEESLIDVRYIPNLKFNLSTSNNFIFLY